LAEAIESFVTKARDDNRLARRDGKQRANLDYVFEEENEPEEEEEEDEESDMVEVYGRRGLNDKRVNGMYVLHPSKTYLGRSLETYRYGTRPYSSLVLAKEKSLDDDTFE